MLLYAVYAGSKLYDLVTPDSDQDIRGVFIPPVDELYSLNIPDYYEDIPSDTVLFSLTKFANLALKNNPNTLDLLFAPVDKWLYAVPEWDKFYNIRYYILSKRALHAYRGFILQEYDKWLVNKTPRGNLIEQYGYDGKMISHVMRLMYQLADIEMRGTYSPVLLDWQRSVVYGMKTHQMERSYVEKVVKGWVDTIKTFKGALLLDEPDYKLVNRTVVDIHTTVLGCND